MYDPPGLPPPGWYPDPERPGASRWWDGAAWAAPAWAADAASADALPDTGSMVSGAFRRALRRWRALAVLGVVAGALPAVLGLLAVRRTVDGLAVIDDEFVGWSDDRIPTVVALVAAAVAAGWIGSLAIAWLMMRTFDDEVAARGGPMGPLTTGGEVGDALTALLRAGAVLPRALLWFVLGALAWLAAIAALVGLFVIAWPLAIVLFLAYIPLGVWLICKLAFTVQAIIDRGGNPYARSWAVSRGRFWPVFGRVILAAVIANMISYGVSTVSSFATSTENGFGRATAFEVDEQGEIDDIRFEELVPDSPISIAVTALSALVGAMFATSTLMVALTELYRTRNPPPG